MKILIVMVITAWLSACEKTPESAPPPRPALVIKVGEYASLNQGMVLVGEVKSRYESNISFRIPGKIIARNVDVGNVVKKGQRIASIDATDTRLSAQAASADVRSAEARDALARAELERQRLLYEKKFISKSALDMREAEYKTSSAQLQQVKSQAAVSGNQTRYTHLLADRDGIVAQVDAEPGQVVAAGQMIAQIVDRQHIEVLVAAPESRMQNIEVGKQVKIKLWADSQKTYQGVIREVAPSANSATRAFDVRVSVLAPDDAIKLGMTAGVSFDGELEKNFAIPSTALTKINGVNSVWVISQAGIAMPRPVTSGQFTESGVEITSGLQAGEMIAIAGVHTLIKGQHVIPQLVSSESTNK